MKIKFLIFVLLISFQDLIAQTYFPDTLRMVSNRYTDLITATENGIKSNLTVYQKSLVTIKYENDPSMSRFQIEGYELDWSDINGNGQLTCKVKFGSMEGTLQVLKVNDITKAYLDMYSNNKRIKHEYLIDHFEF